MINALERKQHLCVIEPGRSPQDTSSAYATIGEEIIFKTEVLDALAVGGCQPIHYDFLLLCAAVEFADRKWKRSQSWSRVLHVTVPVIKLETWESTEVKTCLEQVLRYLTGDTWQFEFVQATNLDPMEFKQLKLHFDDLKTFAIAYSEGLDSRAVSALSGSKDEALCVRVANKHQHAQNGDSFFTQVPFKVKNGPGKESSFRTRSFQFAAVTAVAAHIRGVNRIVVPESGQGALAPAILPLYRVYPDYRNYPPFFRHIEELIKQVLGHEVNFEQPRLWSTKGETLIAFLKLPGKNPKDLINTKSCWQSRHVVNIDRRRLQCGLCAACLLRRLSLHTAGVEEPDGTYVIEDLKTSDLYEAMSAIPIENDQKRMIDYGSVGARHFQQFADMVKLDDDDLFTFALEIADAIKVTPEESLRNLRMLLTAHAEEWRSFLFAQGEKSFLHNWMDGGNYGRFE